jgi:hypothetical protein
VALQRNGTEQTEHRRPLRQGRRKRSRPQPVEPPSPGWHSLGRVDRHQSGFRRKPVQYRRPSTLQDSQVVQESAPLQEHIGKIANRRPLDDQSNVNLLFRFQIDDQICLLINSWCELLLFSCCFRSMSTPGEIRVSLGKSITLNQARDMGMQACIERMLNFTEQLRRLRVDQYEYVAMKVIVLLTSGERRGGRSRGCVLTRRFFVFFRHFRIEGSREGEGFARESSESAPRLHAQPLSRQSCQIWRVASPHS